MSLIGFQLSAQIRANNRRKDECSDHNPKMVAQGGVWGRFECSRCGWNETCDRSIAEGMGLEWKLNRDIDGKHSDK